MTTTPRPTPPRTGYLIAALVDVVLLYLINGYPGWRALPFLTEAARDVVVSFDIALAVGVVVNLVCLVLPHQLPIRVGEVVTTAAGLAALVHLNAVFPFTFDGGTVDWTTVTRLGLIFVIVVVSIALVVQLARLVIALLAPRHDDTPSNPRPVT
ncbi:hypothetical protein GCM10010492_58350 [Saccharothrix mutabilis subsp. mutabilis]|uniref:Uncharacterized protein n=1 Tax=Saccharothrix mutabilis subsp. mutabilis TaxID=66855 RepID=A0ABP3E2C2_9PSEU